MLENSTVEVLARVYVPVILGLVPVPASLNVLVPVMVKLVPVPPTALFPASKIVVPEMVKVPEMDRELAAVLVPPPDRVRFT